MVGLLYPDLLHTISEELKWVISLPDHIWRSLAEFAGRDPLAVRGDIIHAAHISYHFLWRRVLEPAQGLPWSLCRGNLQQNLEDLAAEDCPDEPVSSQLWMLWHGGYSQDQCVQVVRLLGQVGWTSLPCEQQHGSLAMLKRWHPEYTEATLIARGLMHQACRILPQESTEEKAIAAINRKISKICRAAPERAGGQHMLMKALISVAKGRKEPGGCALAPVGWFTDKIQEDEAKVVSNMQWLFSFVLGL